MTALALSFLSGLSLGLLVALRLRRRSACALDAVGRRALCPLEPPPPRHPHLTLIRTLPKERR